MSSTRLQDDLLHDFKEQKTLIQQQLEVFDPLGTALSKPAARRLVGKGALILAEILCYLLAAGAIALAFFLQKVYPFFILSELRNRTEYRTLGSMNIEVFNMAIYAFIGLIAVLFLIIAGNVRNIRLKNDILHLAAKNIKTLVGQHLQRKAAIDTITQRHFDGLPDYSEEGVKIIGVNDVLNPGYDESI